MAELADALSIPKSLITGGDWRFRLESIKAVAKPLMALEAGEMIDVPSPSPESDRWFVRRKGVGPADTYNFPNDHPRSGESRFRWTDGDNGIRLGYREPDVKPIA